MSKRRPKYHPSQTSLSPQDVSDYTTPEGAAQANEEMRRLGLSLKDITERLDSIMKPEEERPVLRQIIEEVEKKDPAPDGEIIPPRWGLTVLNDTAVEKPKMKQGLHFVNTIEKPVSDYDLVTSPIQFKVTHETLNDAYKTLENADSALIKGLAHTAPEKFWFEEIMSAKCHRSIEVDSETGKFQFVNDEDNPDSSKYYGTDSTGALGYHDLTAGGTDELVKVSGDDATAGYLEDKITEGAYCATFTIQNEGADEKLQINVMNPWQVKVSSDDTTQDYLIDKLAAGTGIVLTETNGGGDESVTIKTNLVRTQYKTANQTESSDSVQSDSHLQRSLAASTKYTFEAVLFVANSGSVTQDMKIQFYATNSPTITGTMTTHNFGGGFAVKTNIAESYEDLTAVISITEDIPNTVSDAMLVVKGMIETSSASTLTLKWCGNVSGQNFTVKKYSHITFTEVT